MVRYLFVAGIYVASALAAPAQDAAQVGAAPAGWGDRPASGGWSFGSFFSWPKSSRPSQPAAEDEDSTPASYYAPPPSAESSWRDRGSGYRGSSGSSPSSDSGRSGSLFAPPASSSSGSGGFWGGLFGGGSRPKPASSSSGGSSWWKPKPETDSSSGSSWWKPKPESDSGSRWKPKPEKPEPEWPKSPESAAPAPEPAVMKPEPAQPKPEPAQPKPEPAQPKPDTGLTGSAPASPLGESSESSEAVPAPAQPKPEAQAAPKPATDSSSSSSDSSSVGSGAFAGDVETVRKRLWQPKVGSKWQIILDGVPDTKQPTLKPDDAHIWDIDLWDASATDIAGLKKSGKKVICYFSAGTSESWRSDYKKLERYNLGGICADDRCTKYWGGENWVDIKSNAVWQVMKERIKMASDKGCDAIDPDNMDGYDNMIKNTKGGGLTKFSENDSVKYLKYMADEAAKLNMSTGLKNSLSIIPKVSTYVQFAVNEECAKVKECAEYKQLLTNGKPVFHIEYTGGSSGPATSKVTYKDQAGATKKFCNPLREAVSRFSTIIKAGETLSNQYLYCDGKPADFTPMASFTDKKLGKGRGNFVGGSGESADESDVDSRERFAQTSNSTIIDEEQSSNSTIVARSAERSWAVRRRHRRAVMIDFDF